MLTAKYFIIKLRMDVFTPIGQKRLSTPADYQLPANVQSFKEAIDRHESKQSVVNQKKRNSYANASATQDTRGINEKVELIPLNA